MLLKPENTYHPFTDSYISVFLKDSVDSDGVVGQVISDVNLYYQPVQIPLVAFIFLAIKLFLLAIAEFLQIKVFRLMKKENGVVKDITQVVVCAQMVFWPFWIFFASLTDFIHPINKIFGSWFCHTSTFIFRVLSNIMSSHSLVSALLRYVFIVREEVTHTYGKKKIKDFFFFLSIMMPLSMAIWEMIEGPDLDGLSFVNKCHGKHHRVFLTDTSSLNVGKRNFCGFIDYKTIGMWSKILATIHQASCITMNIVHLIIGLNILEGIVFFRIFSHIRRQHKAMMIKLKKLLPDASKNQRSRRIVLNIQITILGWLVEVFGCLTVVVGVYIVGHGDGNVTLTLQIISMVLYGILLPCSILVNSSEVKDYIAESVDYARVIKWFGCHPAIYSASEDEEETKYEGNDENEPKKSDENPVMMNKHQKDRSPNEQGMRRQKHNQHRKMMKTSNSNKKSSALEVQDLENIKEI